MRSRPVSSLASAATICAAAGYPVYSQQFERRYKSDMYWGQQKNRLSLCLALCGGERSPLYVGLIAGALSGLAYGFMAPEFYAASFYTSFLTGMFFGMIATGFSTIGTYCWKSFELFPDGMYGEGKRAPAIVIDAMQRIHAFDPQAKFWLEEYAWDPVVKVRFRWWQRKHTILIYDIVDGKPIVIPEP